MKLLHTVSYCYMSNMITTIKQHDTTLVPGLWGLSGARFWPSKASATTWGAKRWARPPFLFSLVQLIAEKLDYMWLYDIIITCDMVGIMVIYGYTNMNWYDDNWLMYGLYGLIWQWIITGFVPTYCQSWWMFIPILVEDYSIGN